MSLYRQNYFEMNDQREHIVPSGQITSSKVTVGEDNFIALEVIHTEANSQDLSLRAWVSKSIAGNPLEHAVPQVWHPKRIPGDMVAFMTADAPYPDFNGKNVTVITVPPGEYWFNVLNLINTNNKFRVQSLDSSKLTEDGEDGSYNCDC